MSDILKVTFYGYTGLGATEVEVIYPIRPREEDVHVLDTKPTRMIVQGEIIESTHVQWLQRAMRLLKTSKKHKYNPQFKYGIVWESEDDDIQG